MSRSMVRVHDHPLEITDNSRLTTDSKKKVGLVVGCGWWVIGSQIYSGVEQSVPPGRDWLMRLPMLDTSLPFSVYVIQSENGRRYIGISADVTERITAHNQGRSQWTKRHQQWVLVHKEDYASYTEARKRENYLKSLKGGRKFLEIIYSGVEQSGSSLGS
ncbi:MAG: GIY-YIG nuclease family protein [Candidatus Moraniibacteriota bacterium]|nr:MAG: GIY-YIG nuclease family protein [Candidatus Moranbacteria bacterium]